MAGFAFVARELAPARLRSSRETGCCGLSLRARQVHCRRLRHPARASSHGTNYNLLIFNKKILLK
jgi:hypothetical protein